MKKIMKSKPYIFSCMVLFVLSCCAKKTTVRVGQKAPNFSLADTTGKIHNLSDFWGKKVALYFFPKAGKPYCTSQACSLRDNFSTLKEKGIVVLGISNDLPGKQKNFSVKHNLPFLLFSHNGEQQICFADNVTVNFCNSTSCHYTRPMVCNLNF